MSRGAGELLESLRDDHHARQRALDAFVEANVQHRAAVAWVASLSAQRDARAAAAVEVGVRQADLARRISVAKPVVSLMVKRHRERQVSGTGRAGSPASDQPPRGGMGTPSAEELASPPVPES